jgi:hypothetical protein
MNQSEFVIDTFDGDVFEGFTEGESWNGWACPYFTFEQAQKVAESHKQAIANAWYDEKSDTFNFQMDKDAEDDIEPYEGVAIEGQKFYSIGHSHWVWRENK